MTQFSPYAQTIFNQFNNQNVYTMNYCFPVTVHLEKKKVSIVVVHIVIYKKWCFDKDHLHQDHVTTNTRA